MKTYIFVPLILIKIELNKIILTFPTTCPLSEMNDPFSTSSFLPSVPCPPVDVEPTLDCSTGFARVHWAASRGARFYSVRATGVEEHECGCETESQSCVLTELMCGLTYNISVTAVNSVCNVSHSAVTQMKAGEGDGWRDLAFLRPLKCSVRNQRFGQCSIFFFFFNYFFSLT